MVKKTVITLGGLLIFLSALPLAADDGSWSKSFSVTGGSIYAETEHPEIALEKELLVFDGAATRAVFLFKNTSDRNVTVGCGFPVRHELNTFRKGEHLFISEDSYGEGGEIPALAFFDTVPVDTLGYSEDEAMFLHPEAIPLTPANNRREFLPFQENLGEISFGITQDGDNVPLEKVLLERHAGEDGAWITFHFKHDLAFRPGESSVVRVEYTQDLFFGNEGGMADAFRWIYTIGTGGTWKGPIGEFYFIKASGWKGEIKGMTSVHREPAFEIYRARGYEPEAAARFDLRSYTVDMMEQYVYLEEEYPRLKKLWTGGAASLTSYGRPRQEFVTAPEASSALSDHITIYTPRGVLAGNFGPLAAFDGIPETAWCENIPGHGIGEYLEITLSETVWGIDFHNGFTRLPVEEWMFKDGTFENRIRDDGAGLKDYYSMNGRVKRLAIADAEGAELYTLELKDQRDRQSFAGIALPPGTYRFIIREAYPGTRWEDTCLGEIIFLDSGGNRNIRPFLEDPFYREALGITRF